MEGLAVASSAAGLVSLGLTICEGLLKFYASWKGAEDDIKCMYSSVEVLAKTFICLRNSIQQSRFSRDIVAIVEESIAMCKSGVEALKRKLAKIDSVLQANHGWSHRMRSQFHRALYPFKESTIVKLKEICSDLQGTLTLALETLQIYKSVRLGERATFASERQDTSLANRFTWLSAYCMKFDSEQYVSDIYDWLSPLAKEFNRKQYDTFNITARQDRLSHWVLQSKDYQEWLQSAGVTLWCLGIRGAGKTVLASFIVNALHEIGNDAVGVAYVYCNYSEAEKQKPTNLLKCILLQLVSRKGAFTEELAQAYKKHSKEGTAPSLTECCRLLQAAIGSFHKTYLVIDALDECAETTRDILFAELRKMKPQINILITSRHTFTDLYDSRTTLRLDIKADVSDIRQYLEERITKSKVLQAYMEKDENLHDGIITGIVNKAKGMFLLARLHLDSLLAKTTLRKMKKALGTLPEELDRTYDQVMQRIQAQTTDHAVLALKVLGWIHHAARPLSTLELQHALAVEPGDAQFDEDGIPDVSLVLSYLERRWVDFFSDAQTETARICVTYLSFDEFARGPSPDDGSFDARIKDFPLLQYTSQCWIRHTRDTSEVEVKALALNFLKQEAKVASFVQASEASESRVTDHARVTNHSQRFRRNVQGLWVAASNGLHDLTVTLLEDSESIEAEDSEGERPLHRAAMNGHYDIILLLVEHHANIHAESHSGATALHYAASNGHEMIVRLLIDKGAVLETQKDGYEATALYRAAEAGHHECVQLLIDRGAQVDIRNYYDQTALHRAADVGYLSVAEILLEHGADCTIKDYYGFTPRYRALDMSHYDVADLISKFSPPPLAHSTS
ncbi:hypothetical protein BDR22DRAFT_799687 [Usnea florida]